MAKEPAGTPDPGDEQQPPDPGREEPHGGDSTSRDEPEIQGTLPLGGVEWKPLESSSDSDEQREEVVESAATGDSGKDEDGVEDGKDPGMVVDSGQPKGDANASEAGEDSPHDHDEYHHDEYSDDHYGYHDDQYQDSHDEYHDEYHQDFQHEDSHGGYGYSGAYGSQDNDEEDEEEEEYGGPVKPFLDHLEDFRWMLVKVVATILIFMVVALVAVQDIVAFLTWPLEKAQQTTLLPQDAEKRFVPVLLGPNRQLTTIKGTNALYNIFPEKRNELLALNDELARLESQQMNNAVRTRMAAIQKRIFDLQKAVDSITALRLIPGPQANLGVTNQPARFPLTLEVDQNRSNARTPWKVELKNYDPLSTFIVWLKIALFGGIAFSIPIVLYHVGQFVLPALRVTEKKWVFRVVGFGTLLFIIGAAFCYLLVLGITLWFSVGFSHMLGISADEWRAGDYIGFVAKFMIGMGLAFQMPLIILTLVKVGLADHERLSNFRVYSVVINLVVAAIITPTGDPFTMCLVAGPLQILYEISILIARRWAKQEREAELRAEAEDS